MDKQTQQTKNSIHKNVRGLGVKKGQRFEAEFENGQRGKVTDNVGESSRDVRKLGPHSSLALIVAGELERGNGGERGQIGRGHEAV